MSSLNMFSWMYWLIILSRDALDLGVVARVVEAMEDACAAGGWMDSWFWWLSWIGPRRRNVEVRNIAIVRLSLLRRLKR